MNWNTAARHLATALSLGGLGVAGWRDPSLALALALWTAGLIVWWRLDGRKVVRADRVEVVTTRGEPRAVLGFQEAGDAERRPGASLVLLDAAGVRRAALSGSDTGPGLNLYDGASRAGLYIFESSPRLSMSNDRCGAELSSTSRGPEMALFEGGEPTWRVPRAS